MLSLNFENIESQRYIEKFSPGVLYIAPVFVLILALLLYPMFQTIALSLSEGVNTFISLFRTDWFSPVFATTVVWTVVAGSLQLIIGFSVALLINTAFWGRKSVRGLLLIPWVTPAIVVAMIFEHMYDPHFGILNHLFVYLGLFDEPTTILGSTSLALPALIAAAVWKRFPFVMIMVLAGLQDVDESLKQAAIIDGAPYHARLRHVTLPQMMPILKVVILLTIIWTFNHFVIIYATTRGGPSGATSVMAVKVYQLAFRNLDYALSSALAVVMLVVMAAFIVLYIRWLKRTGVNL